MHILHLAHLYHPAPSGSGRVFSEIGKRLVREGHQVTTITTDAFDLEHLWATGRRHLDERETSHQGVRVVRLPVQRLAGSPLLYPVIRRLMVEYARLPLPPSIQLPTLRRMATITPRLPDLVPFLHDPELADVALVHATNITLDFALLPLLAWAKQRKIPYLCTPFTHLGEPGNNALVRYYTMPHQIALLCESAAVFTQTRLEQRFLAEKGVPVERMHTIGVGINPDELTGGNAQSFRQQHAIPDHSPIVLTIGVAAFDKGTLHVVEAMQRLWRQESPATWVQVGPTMSHFEKQVQTLPAQDQQRMRLLGFVSDEERRDALAAADVFVLPSRTDSFGIVYLEAWIYGVPVIGARAGGVPDVITHGTNGLLVSFGEVGELAEAIDALLRDPERARNLGEAGQNMVYARLTWEHQYARIRDIYQQLA